MKTTLYYSFRIFLSKPAISLFIAFEMFLLITAANFALGQYNSHTMLYEPVQDYIERQGFLINIPPVPIKTDDGTERLLMLDDIRDIVGDADIFTLRNLYLADLKNSIDITVIPDEMFDRLRLPLEDGKYFDRDDPCDNLRIIVSSNGTDLKAGDKITYSQVYYDGSGSMVTIGEDITVEVAAQLTDPTYVPHFRYSIDMSYEYMYQSVDSAFYKGRLFCYTSESELDKFQIADGLIGSENMAIVSFKNKLSDEELEAVKAKLNDLGIPTLDNSVIEENSKKLLSDSFMRLLPAVFAFGIVVLTGIVSCSVIGAKSMLKKLAVFYCCGATKRDCILISVGQTIIISIIAAIASVGALTAFVLSGLDSKFGFVLRTDNLILSIGLIVSSILVSAVAPTVMISKADPREQLS